MRLAVVVALAVLACACGGGGNASGSSAPTSSTRRPANARAVSTSAPSGVVPWLDGRTFEVPPATVASAAWPNCAPTNLQFIKTRTGAASGSAYWTVSVRVRQNTPCVVPRPGGFSAISNGGRRSSLAFDPGPASTDNSADATAVAVAPGGSVDFVLSAADVCGDTRQELPRNAYRSIVMTLAGTEFQLGGLRLTLCDNRIALFQVSTPTPAPSRAPGALGSLIPKIEGAHESSGIFKNYGHSKSIDFDILLENPTSTSVSLDPCPPYTETLAGAAMGVTEYPLNCGPVKAIAPHHSIRFAMRLPYPELPTPAHASIATLTWQLFAGSPIAITTLKVAAEPSPS